MSDVNNPNPGAPVPPSNAQYAPPTPGNTTYAPTPAPAKSKRGLVITLIVIALLAIAGGVAAYLFVKNAADAPAKSNGTSEEDTAGRTIDDGEEIDGFLYVSPKGDYTAQFPSKPTETSTQQQIGALTVPFTTVTVESQNEYFTVNAAEFPPEALEQDFDTMLLNSSKGMSANIPGSVIEGEKFGTLGGEKSTTGQLIAEGVPPLTFSITVYEGTQYILLYGGDDKKAAAKFIDTFEFTK